MASSSSLRTKENEENEADKSGDEPDRRGNLNRVGSRSDVTVLRGEGVVSEGGSIVLMEQLCSKLKTVRKPHDYHCDPISNGQNDEYQKERPPRRARLSFSYLNMFIMDLDWALTELGCRDKIGHTGLERIAIILDRVLSQESRHYHNVAHVFEISAGASPLQVLASFFRDAIKTTIDSNNNNPGADRFDHQTKNISCDTQNQSHHEFLRNFFVDNDGSSTKNLIIRPDLSDSRDLLLTAIFGFKPGDNLNARKEWQGIDMFLSALMATRILKDALSIKLTAQLCACIEATIPFRSRSQLEVLHKRVVACNSSLQLGMTTEEMTSLVQQACDLWNRLVGNMASEDPAIFLDHTWRLLPEHERTLQRKTLYTLNDYYSAILAMDRFLSWLSRCSQYSNDNSNNHVVYLAYEGIPTSSELHFFHERFQSNATVALSYSRARLLSVAVVLAMAHLTGGDGPKSYFFGDIPSLNRLSVELGDLVPTTTNTVHPMCNKQVLELLQSDERRLMDVGFDNRNTGVAAFVYAQLGEDELQRLVLKFCEPRMTESSFMSLLQAMPLAQVVEPILKAFGFMTVTREPATSKLLAELKNEMESPVSTNGFAFVKHRDVNHDNLLENTEDGNIVQDKEEDRPSTKRIPLLCRVLRNFQDRRRRLRTPLSGDTEQ